MMGVVEQVRCETCMDSGWINADPERDGPGAPARRCACKVEEGERRRLRHAAAVVRPNWRDVAWERPPITLLAPSTKAQLRRYINHFETYRREGHGLWLTGPLGVGKTCAAALVLKEIAAQHAEVRRDAGRRDSRGGRVWGFWNADQLLRALRASHADDSAIDQHVLHLQLCEIQVLVIDDLRAPRQTEWSKNELYGLINTRYEDRLPTMITTDVDESELRATIGDRTIDRLRERCKPIEIKRRDPSENGYRHYADPVTEPDEPARLDAGADDDAWEQAPPPTYGKRPVS
jgi:DNA replication protein DnaC